MYELVQVFNVSVNYNSDNKGPTSQKRFIDGYIIPGKLFLLQVLTPESSRIFPAHSSRFLKSESLESM